MKVKIEMVRFPDKAKKQAKVGRGTRGCGEKESGQACCWSVGCGLGGLLFSSTVPSQKLLQVAARQVREPVESHPLRGHALIDDQVFSNLGCWRPLFRA